MKFQLLLLLLLICFSHVWFCATPQTAAHQAPPSLGFCRQNTGVGCQFLLQCMKVKSESGVVQLCLTLSDPMDCSLPGSSVHGIFQARVLEWVAIAFSGNSSRTIQIPKGWCHQGSAFIISANLEEPAVAIELQELNPHHVSSRRSCSQS